MAFLSGFVRLLAAPPPPVSPWHAAPSAGKAIATSRARNTRLRGTDNSDMEELLRGWRRIREEVSRHTYASRALFGRHGDARVDARGASCRNERGRKRDEREQHADRSEYAWIARTYADHEATDRAGRGAQRHANTDLARTLAHETRDDTEYAGGGEHECQCRERGQHAARETLLRPRPAKLLREQAEVIQRDIRIDALHGVA